MKRFVTTLAILLIVVASRTDAETVFIRSGINTGQGWMFPFGAACWVATVDHVINSRAVTFVVRDRGVQYFVPSPRQFVDFDLHIALLKLADMAPDDCPTSSAGEDNEGPMLDRVRNEGAPITMERRSALTSAATGTSIGIQVIGVSLRASSDQSDNRRTFAVVPSALTRDQIRKSDSGAPILFHGPGVGEAALPLGLFSSVLDDGAIAVRFDKVRAYIETMQMPRRQANASFSIVTFTGLTLNSECGPQNLESQIATRLCGWILRSQKSGQITLTLYLGDSPQTVSSVMLRFGGQATPREYSVATAPDAGPLAHWKPQHDCLRPRHSDQWQCGVGDRPVRTIRIIVNGRIAEIRDIRVLLAAQK